jgi:hypothetical protein
MRLGVNLSGVTGKWWKGDGHMACRALAYADPNSAPNAGLPEVRQRPHRGHGKIGGAADDLRPLRVVRLCDDRRHTLITR